MYTARGQSETFYLIACIMLLVLLGSSYVLKQFTFQAGPAVSVISMLKLGSDRRILNAMILIATSNACVGNLLALFPAYLQTLSVPPDYIGYYLTTGPAAYIFVSQFAGWLADKRPRYQVGMLGLSVIAVSFALMNMGGESVSKVVLIYAVAFAASSFVDVSQPGVIAAVLDERGADGLYMLGVALGDVSVSVGYTLMVYDSWMEGVIGFNWQLSVTAIWLLLVVILTGVNFAPGAPARTPSLEGLVN